MLPQSQGATSQRTLGLQTVSGSSANHRPRQHHLSRIGVAFPGSIRAKWAFETNRSPVARLRFIYIALLTHGAIPPFHQGRTHNARTLWLAMSPKKSGPRLRPALPTTPILVGALRDSHRFSRERSGPCRVGGYDEKDLATILLDNEVLGQA